MIVEIISVIVVLLFVEWLRMKPFYWKRKGIPYSIPLPFFGNSLESFYYSFSVYWERRYKTIDKKSGIHGQHVFGRLALVLVDPALIKEVLIQKADNFTSRGIYTNPNHDLLARNVFHSSGDDWKSLRAKLTPYFSPARLKNMTTMMLGNMREFSEQLELSVDSKKNVDINELSLKLTTDIVVNTIFGVEPDSFKNPDSFFFSLQGQLFGHNFVLRILLGVISPFLYNLFRVTVIPSTTSSRLQEFVEEVLDQRSKNIGVRPDFIQGMLDLVQKESNDRNGNDGKKPFGREDATAQCMVMYLGGTETTGNTISYLLYELALHQDIQEKVRLEINRVLADTESGVFSYEQHKLLTYTNMVIDECLRKYPIVPVVTRKCTKATRVRDIDIDLDTGIFVPIKAIHWDPTFYPEPEKFIPERFSTEKYQDNSIYMPFGLGPRTCIGWKMALIETAFTLCEVIPKFRFLPSDKTKSQISFSRKPTLNPEGGIWLRVERI